jgi:hypothetical protein
MYLLIDRYNGAVYKLDKISVTLEEGTERGDLIILDIGECNTPKILEGNKFLEIELEQ